MTLQAHKLGALILESGRMPAATSVEAPALYVGRISPASMSPLITREIFFRLLQGDRGGHLAQIALDGGRVMKIARAIRWLKDNFAATDRETGQRR